MWSNCTATSTPVVGSRLCCQLPCSIALRVVPSRGMVWRVGTLPASRSSRKDGAGRKGPLWRPMTPTEDEPPFQAARHDRRWRGDGGASSLIRNCRKISKGRRLPSHRSQWTCSHPSIQGEDTPSLLRDSAIVLGVDSTSTLLSKMGKQRGDGLPPNGFSFYTLFFIFLFNKLIYYLLNKVWVEN